MRVVDSHVHIFPDRVAAIALPRLQENSGVTPAFDGTLAGLRAVMTRAGVETSVVQPIATKPEAVTGINDWAASIQGDGVLCFGAMHPRMREPAAELARMAGLGLRGLKLHPEFQTFRPDDDAMAPVYQGAAANGLTIFFHAGEDIAIPTIHSSPAVFGRVLDAFPGLTVVLAHMGGWRQWDAVLQELAGRDVYLETSYTLPYIGPERFVELIEAHGASRVIFGSDGPWADPRAEIAAMEGLLEHGIDQAELTAIMAGNAGRLLGIGAAEAPGSTG